MHATGALHAGRIALAVTLALAGPGLARAAFQDIEVSPRARALGGAWVGLRGDEYAPLHNPAGLAWATRGVAASYVRPFGFDFVSQSVVSATAALPRQLGGAGVAVRQFGVEYNAENLTSETTVALAHGFQLLADRQSQVALGYSVNYYALEYGRSITGIDPGRASAVTLNLGGQAVLRDRTRVGFYSLNVTNASIGDIDHEPLPRGVCAGVSYAPYPGVETSLDLLNALGENVQYRGGAEFQVADYAWLRAGVRTEPNIFTAGIGLRRARLMLDYGFSTGGGVLGETHQVGVGFAWPEGK
jgi:hypothetical protein